MNFGKLYCIKDIVSGLRITGFLEMPNEGVALQSFKKFLDDKEADEKMCFKLVEVAVLEDDCILRPTAITICSGEHADEALKEYIRRMKDFEEM